MGSGNECLALSAELIRQFGYRKEIRVLTFPALTLRSDKRTTLKTSALESLFGGQITSINSVDKPNINFLVRYANLHRTENMAAVYFHFPVRLFYFIFFCLLAF